MDWVGEFIPNFRASTGLCGRCERSPVGGALWLSLGRSNRDANMRFVQAHSRLRLTAGLSRVADKRARKISADNPCFLITDGNA